MTTDIHTRQILQINDYLINVLGATAADLQGGHLEDIFTKASLIFLESYVYPSLLDQGIHSELQLTVKAGADARIPIVANVQYDGSQCVYWAIFSAVERDKLYQELIDARDQLEAYAIKLKALASNDALTGLLNRGAAEAKILSTIGKTQRVPAKLSMLGVEIDQLADIVQQLGPGEGDRVLKAVADILTSSLRTVDIVARWTDTKFIVLFYDASTEEAFDISQRAHQSAAEVFIKNDALTLSMGLIQLAINDSEPSSIMEVALSKVDAALYIAKASGGAQTVVFE